LGLSPQRSYLNRSRDYSVTELNKGVQLLAIDIELFLRAQEKL
jgi:hypothetical protein